MHRNIFLIMLLCLLTTGGFAQETNEPPQKNAISNFSFIPLPVIASNPTSGWMFGLAPGATWFMGDPSSTSISSGLGTVIYTTKKQWILTAKTNVFLADDSWNLLGDWRYFITSQPTYGLGTGPQSGKPIGTGIEYEDDIFSEPISDGQMMNFNYLRFHETVLKRYRDSRFFAGIGYHLDVHYNIDDKVLDMTTDPQVISSHYAYSTLKGFDPEAYTLSGISFNFLYDSRDNAVNPYSGSYAYANLRVNPEFLGSDQSSSLLWLEYRNYFNLQKERPRHLIGVWTYGWFVTSGDVPYMDLPSVGWDQFGRSGRAYTQGRFRGEDLVYGEVEYRFPLQKQKETLGGVVFLNGTSGSSRTGDIDLMQYLDLGYGLGLRVMLNKKSRANLNIDFAWGKYGAKGFYLGLNEVF